MYKSSRLTVEKEFKKAVNNLNRIHFLDNNFSNLSIYMKKIIVISLCYKVLAFPSITVPINSLLTHTIISKLLSYDS